MTFRQRYSYIQTSAIIPVLLEPQAIVLDETIEMLNKEPFEMAADRIRSAIKNYEHEASQKIQEDKEAREARLIEILKRKKKD